MSTVSYSLSPAGDIYESLHFVSDFRLRLDDHTQREIRHRREDAARDTEEENMRKTIASLLLGAGLVALSGVASAHSSIGVGISFGVPAPVYAPAPVYYAPPPPVVYAPRPVYVAPPPVYYAPAPVYYGPPAYYYPRHHHWRRW